MAYTTINNPSDYFNTLLYTGDGTSPRSLTGVGFQPDFLWIKNRTGANTYEHRWMDAVRGSNYVLHSSTAGAQTTEEYYTVSSFDSDGWTGRSGTGSNQVITGGNDNSYTFVAWSWLAGNTTSANTDGDISSTVSVNSTAGFSIVKYSGSGTGGQTVGHGLGAKPDAIILKAAENGQQWASYWAPLGATKYMRFNAQGVAETSSLRWSNTEPTTSVFTIGTDGEVNTSGEDHIAYCFKSITGYSKIGKYTGNGSTDGTFVYTGFKPAWIMMKATDNATAEHWFVYDVKRRTYNVMDNGLVSNANTNEFSSANNYFDITSNGFKQRTVDGRQNSSGTTYIYMAFAEAPFVGTNNTPATAR